MNAIVIYAMERCDIVLMLVAEERVEQVLLKVKKSIRVKQTVTVVPLGCTLACEYVDWVPFLLFIL